jgi:hypothetical protein
MKRIVCLLALSFLVSCTSASSTPTATPTPEPTQTPIPIPIPTPTPTPIPLSEVDLEPLLLVSGDLPPDFVGGQIRTSVPRQFSAVSPPVNVITLDIYEGDTKAEPGVAVFLYESISDVDNAYEVVSAAAELVEPTSDVGERGAFAEKSYTFPFYSTSVKLAFTRCHAVVYLDLFGEGASIDVLTPYAQRLDERLSSLVCR